MKSKLQGFSSAFPGGWPGVGLLLLRAALGVTVVIQAGVFIGHNNPTPTTWTIGLLAIVSGSSLSIGFLTPVASVLVGVAAIFVAMSSFPLTPSNLLGAALPTVFLVVVAAAVVFLGPGALSLDARRFGRREIIIPRIAPSAKP